MNTGERIREQVGVSSLYCDMSDRDRIDRAAARLNEEAADVLLDQVDHDWDAFPTDGGRYRSLDRRRSSSDGGLAFHASSEGENRRSIGEMEDGVRTTADFAAERLEGSTPPAWIVTVPVDLGDGERVQGLTLFFHSLLREAHIDWPLFRAVGLDKLDQVLRIGIDREVGSVVFWADQSVEKAWEYGELPKVLLLLDPKRVEASWREVPSHASEDELATLRRGYPTEIRTLDNTYWFSRLSLDDPRVATGYEIEYGRWIPGDAREALLGLIIFARPADMPSVRNHFA